MLGKTIWIEQTGGKAKLTGGVIGSPTHPVNIIVNGGLEIASGTIIHGNVIVTGSFSVGGGAIINGMLYGGEQVDLGGAGGFK